MAGNELRRLDAFFEWLVTHKSTISKFNDFSNNFIGFYFIFFCLGVQNG
jgi:hypothetical protein